MVQFLDKITSINNEGITSLQKACLQKKYHEIWLRDVTWSKKIRDESDYWWKKRKTPIQCLNTF